MALPEVPQLLSGEVKIRLRSLLDPGLICASHWRRELNKPGTWTQVGPGQQLKGQTVVHQGGRVHLPSFGIPLPRRGLCYLISGRAPSLEDSMFLSQDWGAYTDMQPHSTLVWDM